MRKLLIALIVLLVLFVVADRIAVGIAERRVGAHLAASYGLTSPPRVTIGGFPFLTQVATGDYSDIAVAANSIPAGNVTLSQLNVHFTGVHATIGQVLGHGSQAVTADHAAGSAVLSYAQIDKRLPGGLRVQPSGSDLRLAGGLNYRGLRVRLSALLALTVSHGALLATPHAVHAGGIGLPVSLFTQLATTIPLQTLPLHLHLASIQVTPSGLRVGATARDVHFAQA